MSDTIQSASHVVPYLSPHNNPIREVLSSLRRGNGDAEMKRCYQDKSKELNLGFLGPEPGHHIASSKCNDVLELGEATSKGLAFEGNRT